ncbi:MAG: hypothetical protein A3K19_08520 [Lentisphaerae bacterium RIFOXYB12_FULL_65_16]|nr:MAG: hypothetical protein A3K18_21910 [Lentisphaerae bacterium RIFOXYA12_64_32]OGV93432.1 MAG: hypothetical protein A3K19_08520 [Lentisphaerae bacterium RIFOXYB12_FULL_65_16]
MLSTKDRDTIRRLAGEVAQIAALPVQEQKRRMWRQLNGRRPVRPMVMIDQVCWNEMNVDDELTLRCEDRECRTYEEQLRKILCQWRHFRVDMVVEPFIRVHKAVRNSGFGVSVKHDIAVSDPTNSVVGQAYFNQFETDADLDKIKMPVIGHDTAETARRLEVAHGLFDGTLDIFEQGVDPYLSVWDPISTWMNVQSVLFALVDRPEYMREMAQRMVRGYLSMLDQLEAQGLLCHHQSLIHCTGAYTDELPAPGFDPARPRTKDIWMFGLAQMFSTVSPAMFEEFEIDMCMPIFKRFGLVYYGCCDPMDLKMAQVRKIPNVRKISMSPWVNEEIGATEIKGDYVYSRKPNPALLAWPEFNAGEVRTHLQATVDVCARHGCPLELILKDISTVGYQPQRLWQWADIAMDVVGATDYVFPATDAREKRRVAQSRPQW